MKHIALVSLQMELSGQIHVPTVLSLGKGLPVPIY